MDILVGHIQSIGYYFEVLKTMKFEYLSIILLVKEEIFKDL